MGDVSLLTSSLQRALRGEPVDPAPLLRFVRAKRGIPANKVKAAGAALLFTDTAGRGEGYEALDVLLDFEEANGPRAKEPLCPDSKAGIYGLAEVALVTFGLREAAATSYARRLAERQLALTGQRLALYDLIATPDGDVTGLPGVRSNSPSGPKRSCESYEYREWRGMTQRGPSGRPRPLQKANPTTDEQAIFSAPAWWWRMLDDATGARREFDMLRRQACLPPALPLALVVYRWPTGTLAYFERPANIKEWLTYGSAASKKDPDHTEDVCSSILMRHVAPGRHVAEHVILSWGDDPPVERVPSGAVRTRVPAVGEARP